MPEAYELHEARFVQEKVNTSAANGLTTNIGPVPAGKVWTLLAGYLMPSTAETKTVWFVISGQSSSYPVTVPATIALSNVIPFPLLTDGMELKMYPGQQLRAYRDSATAGSTISMGIEFIESDLPYYAYEEPQNKVVRKVAQHGSVYRSSGAISPGGGGGVGPGGHGGGGGGGGSQPV